MAKDTSKMTPEELRLYKIRVNNLKMWKKGESGNYHGRPTRIRQLEKALDMKFPTAAPFPVIKELFGGMILMTLDELKQVSLKKNTPVVAVILASALIKNIKAGKMDAIEKAFDRVYGKAIQTVDQTSSDGSMSPHPIVPVIEYKRGSSKKKKSD